MRTKVKGRVPQDKVEPSILANTGTCPNHGQFQVFPKVTGHFETLAYLSHRSGFAAPCPIAKRSCRTNQNTKYLIAFRATIVTEACALES